MSPAGIRRTFTSALGVLLAATAVAEAPPARHVQATLLAESDAVRPGQPLTLGIRLVMDPGWHTYWRNPGDAGLPTRVRWQLPEGFVAGEIRWPRPIQFRTGPLVSYGYADEVLLLVDVTAPPSIGARDVRIAGRVDWLECQEACLPGKADVAVTLPVRRAASAGPHAALFAAARRLLPARDPSWRFSAAAGETLDLSIQPPRGKAVDNAYLYPLTPRLLDYARPQVLARQGARYRLALARDPNGRLSERLAGVLVADTPGGEMAVEVDVPLASPPDEVTQEKMP